MFNNNIAFYFLAFVIGSCNYESYNDKIVKNIDNENMQDSSENTKCYLETDTFSFKGIVLRGEIKNVKNLYGLSKGTDVSEIVEDFKKYKVADNRITIYEQRISEIELYVYKSKIYRIEIALEGNDFIKSKYFSENNQAYLPQVVVNLAEKYKSNCVSRDEKGRLRLSISNERTSIEASSYFGVEKPLELINSRDQKMDKISMKGICQIIVVDLEIENIYNSSLESIFNTEKEKAKKDY